MQETREGDEEVGPMELTAGMSLHIIRIYYTKKGDRRERRISPLGNVVMSKKVLHYLHFKDLKDLQF